MRSDWASSATRKQMASWLGDGLEVAVLGRAVDAVLRAVRIERLDEVALVGREQRQALARASRAAAA